MTGVTLRLEGADLYREALTTLEMAARRRIVTAATRAGAKEILTVARRMAPVRSGRLRRQLASSIKFDRVNGKVTATIKAKKTKADKREGARHAGRYLHLVVSGTKPHEISPANRDALAIGVHAYARITHPGARGRPFLDTAADAVWRDSVRAFDFKFSERLIIEINKLPKLPPANV